jgi:ribonuclease T2
MLRPHLFLTILIFALIFGLAAHFAVQGNWFSGPASNYGSNGAPAGTTTTGKDNTSAGDTNDSDSQDNDDSGGSVSYPNNYANDGQRNVAGQFDYYALVLSWSPSYCAEKGDRDQQQCNRRDGRRYSFVLHGLWPQYERGYPSACRLSRRPFVPDPVISSMLDIMPSRGLVIHEYRTHGTCSGLDPSRYFATAHRLFDGITIPERFRNPMQAQFVSPYDIRSEFLRANPNLAASMIAVACNSRDKSLKEIHICYSKDGHPRACGQNENQNKLCSVDRVFIPPARSTAREDAQDRQTQPAAPSLPKNSQGSPLPGPRVDYDYGHQNQ